MKELLTNWITALQQNDSLLLLLRDMEMLICFETGENRFYISISNDRIEIGEMRIDDLPNVIIKASEGIIFDLLHGEFLLRELLHDPSVKIQSSFRNILRLESLFKLGQIPIEVTRQQLEKNGINFSK